MQNSTRARLLIAALIIAGSLVLAFTLARPRMAEPTASTAVPERSIPAADVATLAHAPHLLIRHAGTDANYNHLSVAPIAEPNARRATTSLECERLSFGGGRGLCLQADRGVFTTYRAVIFDDQFKVVHSMKLDGSPTRTRVSRDGRVGAMTVFVSGQEHGYASSSFSTKTTIVDLASGDDLGQLEQFTTWRDGQRFSAKDFNFWGVTFTSNSNIFYASLKTAGQTYLVRGELGLRKLTVLHQNVECPAVSPDDRLIAYKKRVGGNLAPWRFYVLDVATMRERPIAGEKRSIDDQLEWFDDRHVLYSARRSSQSAVLDVWIAAVDSDEPAREFVVQADSPIVVR
jgi:hypothetical protein